MAPPSKHRGEFEVVVGVVGKPSAAQKSTFFNAVTRSATAPRQKKVRRQGSIAVAHGSVAKVEFTTIDPNVRIYPRSRSTRRCPDPALALGRPLSERARRTAATRIARRLLPVLLKDVAGLVPGAYAGNGKGNRFLNDLCDADARVDVENIRKDGLAWTAASIEGSRPC